MELSCKGDKSSLFSILGDIICDPMCGTGSICLEGVNSFPNTFHIGGELHSEGCQNAGKNFKWLEELHCPGQRLVITLDHRCEMVNPYCI